jgi:hypothetical protein
MKVRLTESQLHRVIKESVKRILEDYGMDWRTGANAAYQSENADPQRIAQYDAKHGQGAWNRRADRFNNYAYNSFNKNMGYNNINGESYHMWGNNFNQRKPSVATQQGTNLMFNSNPKDDDTLLHTTFYKNGGADQHLTGNGPKDYWGNRQIVNLGNRNGYDAYGQNQNLNQVAQRGNQQINDYMNGNSRYIKGQGWQ